MKTYYRPPTQPAPPKAGKTPKKGRWWKRLVTVVVLLFVIGFVGFWWLAYFPLEGKVDRVEALVPDGVEFLYRTSWAELRASGWIKKNVVDEPIHPALDPQKIVVDPQTGQTLAQALEEIPETEAQINDSIPGALKVLEGLVFGTKEFRVEKDLIPGEIVAAGRWCQGGSPSTTGAPRWREILVLTRVSPLVKFAVSAMSHDFVRKQVLAGRADLDVQVTGDGLLRIENLRFVPPRRRETCEGGAEMGPTNVWYVARVKDVIAISNAEDLALKVMRVPNDDERAIERTGFESERTEGAIAVAVDLQPLRSYMNRALSDPDVGKAYAFVGKFVAVNALLRAGATVEPRDDGIRLSAKVHYSDSELREFRDVAATYDVPPASVADGVLRLLPAKDTAVVVQVTSPARPVLRALYDNLSKDDQQAITLQLVDQAAENRAAGKPAYDDMGQFLDDFASHLGTTSAVAIARIPSVFDKQKYETWYYGDDVVPQVAAAILVKVPDGARQEDVDTFLSERVGVLGFKSPERVKSPEGIEYSRMRMKVVTAEYSLAEPAFVVHDGYVILATREDYLLRILAVMRGGPGAPQSIAASDGFRTAMGSLPSKATIAVYAHGDTLRALLWDFRNEIVRKAHSEDVHRDEFIEKWMRDAGRASPGQRLSLTKELTDKRNEDLAAEMKRFKNEGYSTFVADFRKDLDRSKRVQAFGAVMQSVRTENRLDVGVRVVVK